MLQNPAQMHRLLFLLLALTLPSSPMAATRYTLIGPESSEDARMDYYRAAMQLALEKTRPEYGDYELLDSVRMNKARMRLEVQKPGRSALFIVDSWPQERPHPEVSLLPFPIDLGILSYRVCFVGPESARALAGVRSLSQLQGFSQGVGKGCVMRTSCVTTASGCMRWTTTSRCFAWWPAAGSTSSAAAPTRY